MARLLILFFLFGHVFGDKKPDVECLVMDLKYVSCVWNQKGPPAVNYTLISWFSSESREHLCSSYLSENNVTTGCIRPYTKLQRFGDFHTKLLHGNETVQKKMHDLKGKVLLNPPTNQTVVYGEDNKKLCLYWNQSHSGCVESEVRYWRNNQLYKPAPRGRGIQDYCINWAETTKHYVLQVRSKIESDCGGSELWSNWSEPVEWGSNNTTDSNQTFGSGQVWSPIVYAVCAITLVILVVMLLHHERLRVIPVVPKPALKIHDIEDWFQFPKGLKESFKTNYNERACPVREYCHVSQSDSESSGSSTSSLTTDQTDCSVSMPLSDPEGLSSSTSTLPCDKELQESV